MPRNTSTFYTSDSDDEEGSFVSMKDVRLSKKRTERSGTERVKGRRDKTVANGTKRNDSGMTNEKEERDPDSTHRKKTSGKHRDKTSGLSSHSDKGHKTGRKSSKRKHLIEESDNDLSSDDDSDRGYDTVSSSDSEDETHRKDLRREKRGRDERRKIPSGNKKSKSRRDSSSSEEEDDEDVSERRRTVDRIKKRVRIDERSDKGSSETKGNQQKKKGNGKVGSDTRNRSGEKGKSYSSLPATQSDDDENEETTSFRAATDQSNKKRKASDGCKKDRPKTNDKDSNSNDGKSHSRKENKADDGVDKDACADEEILKAQQRMDKNRFGNKSQSFTYLKYKLYYEQGRTDGELPENYVDYFAIVQSPFRDGRKVLDRFKVVTRKLSKQEKKKCMDGLIDEADKTTNWKSIVFVDEDVFLDPEDEELGYSESVFYHSALTQAAQLMLQNEAFREVLGDRADKVTHSMNGTKSLVDLIPDENNDYRLAFDEEGNVKAQMFMDAVRTAYDYAQKYTKEFPDVRKRKRDTPSEISSQKSGAKKDPSSGKKEKEKSNDSHKTPKKQSEKAKESKKNTSQPPSKKRKKSPSDSGKSSAKTTRAESEGSDRCFSSIHINSVNIADMTKMSLMNVVGPHSVRELAEEEAGFIRDLDKICAIISGLEKRAIGLRIRKSALANFIKDPDPTEVEESKDESMEPVDDTNTIEKDKDTTEEIERGNKSKKEEEEKQTPEPLRFPKASTEKVEETKDESCESSQESPRITEEKEEDDEGPEESRKELPEDKQLPEKKESTKPSDKKEEGRKENKTKDGGGDHGLPTSNDKENGPKVIEKKKTDKSSVAKETEKKVENEDGNKTDKKEKSKEPKNVGPEPAKNIDETNEKTPSSTGKQSRDKREDKEQVKKDKRIEYNRPVEEYDEDELEEYIEEEEDVEDQRTSKTKSNSVSDSSESEGSASESESESESEDEDEIDPDANEILKKMLSGALSSGGKKSG